ncbi:putative solute carrier protein [Diaporthe ampelina]|uniref:Putative solute carrier protein n=1 Tax=Diaporthe ampelina TaxID=1214573 RepID=A0A0G2FP37_9PEZI|nr:putative solute carrier protein [Diaporthe ampelina]
MAPTTETVSNKALYGGVGGSPVQTHIYSEGDAREATTTTTTTTEDQAVAEGLQQIQARKAHWYSYLTTWDFWTLILLGQVLTLCNTATSTFTSFLVEWGTSIPAFQTFFNYVLLSAVYVPYMFYRYGWRKVGRVALSDGWKYLVLAFLDVEGNYFTVLAYRYTNILSAQLINFWSIVCVVAVSFALLRVRYKLFQILGILVACGGMGMLLGSDAMTGTNNFSTPDMLKGDLFCLAGATCYGLSNVFEEWCVSRRPVYEVLGFMGLLGMCVGGATAGIFDRQTFQEATWNGPVVGYVVGYTLCLFVFYSLAPLMFRMGSAAFFDISLLTGNFWGVIIGIHVFGYAVHYLYPVAFVLIIIGLVVYFLAGSMLGDSKKPWLGENQEGGVAGIGTAKLKALNEARRRGLIADERV